MDQPEQQLDFASITADIVSSYVANNAVHRTDLPNVIASVHAALQGLTAPKQTEPEKPEPAVSIRRSITPDFLISLEDGKKYKTLKRHLGKLGLTAEEYRAKWGLPADYPMVAPNYAAKRSELAKSSGLGQRRKTTAKAVAAPEETVTARAESSMPKRGRRSKKSASE
ncbi:MucR family transcriptional regulator [Microvirga tunisiensis]|uniref:MucR family transcriptional regulator n=1 Tax=Microvirga tunisiensis TaxID=2108360 RepID=A0A5N7MT96_9HYPH|nr:MucR family transcriptional regulator [Microvirga tunisiensis]MPR12256.1 MucR family transcriptional regulator [Microvirga tunisiensis]MPR30222.1 MucR family transcriptional regulator [Microvirga tunisiensis]